MKARFWFGFLLVAGLLVGLTVAVLNTPQEEELTEETGTVHGFTSTYRGGYWLNEFAVVNGTRNTSFGFSSEYELFYPEGMEITVRWGASCMKAWAGGNLIVVKGEGC